MVGRQRIQLTLDKRGRERRWQPKSVFCNKLIFRRMYNKKGTRRARKKSVPYLVKYGQLGNQLDGGGKGGWRVVMSDDNDRARRRRERCDGEGGRGA